MPIVDIRPWKNLILYAIYSHEKQKKPISLSNMNHENIYYIVNCEREEGSLVLLLTACLDNNNNNINTFYSKKLPFLTLKDTLQHIKNGINKKIQV